MEEKLDFSLPEKKRGGGMGGKLTVVLLLVLVVLTAGNLFWGRSGREVVAEKQAQLPSADETKQLAGKLAQRNLYDRAAKVWQDYLSMGELRDKERARALFQVGTLLEKAGSYAAAIEYYYRSEMAAKVGELESPINAHIKDCFEKLGKFSALRYELMDRTSFRESEQAGGKIVAEIGAEKITEADLDAMIEGDIENRISPWAAFLTDEQLKEQKRKMLEQYKGVEAKQGYLQTWVAQEVLYREALEARLAEEPGVKKLINMQARDVLSQQLMNRELAAKINVTETDLQTYYTANASSYVEPASARISHIVVDDEQQANELLGRVKEGEEFGELAKGFSKDESTKEGGGKIETGVSKGSYVAGIGDNRELNDKIFASDAGVVLEEAFETETGWEIVRVDEKQAERQKSFDEVREQVMSTLLSQKRQDVQQEYVRRMMAKYGVILHGSAFGGGGEDEPESNKSQATK
jgi:peptidyl-prolyl cis-trans isomerase C